MGLGNLIENALKNLKDEKERLAELSENENGEEDFLFDYGDARISDSDFSNFHDYIDKQQQEDATYITTRITGIIKKKGE